MKEPRFAAFQSAKADFKLRRASFGRLLALRLPGACGSPCRSYPSRRERRKEKGERRKEKGEPPTMNQLCFFKASLVNVRRFDGRDPHLQLKKILDSLMDFAK